MESKRISLLEKAKNLEKIAKDRSGKITHEKRPRHYFAEIIALSTDEHPYALERVPPEHRPAVAQYLACWQTKREGQIEHYMKVILNAGTRAGRNAALAKTPEDIRADVKMRVELSMLAAKMREAP